MATTFEIGKTYQHPNDDEPIVITARTPKFVSYRHGQTEGRKMVRGKDVEKIEYYAGVYVRADQPYVSRADRYAEEQARAEARAEAQRQARLAVRFPQHARNEEATATVASVNTWALNDDIARLSAHANRIDVGSCMCAVGGGSIDHHLYFDCGLEVIVVRERHGDDEEQFVRAVYGHGLCIHRHAYGDRFEVEPNFHYYDGRYLDDNGTMREEDGSRFEWGVPE